MNRILQYLNFVGVAVLAVLCCQQWSVNSQVNLALIDSERTRLGQLAKISEQEKTIHGYAMDLDEFRQRLSLSESQLKDSIAERDQLKVTLDKWIAALAARDEALKQASQRIQKLATERNDAVLKFNDLAGKYNEIVSKR